jgi:hypothetical protein
MTVVGGAMRIRALSVPGAEPLANRYENAAPYLIRLIGTVLDELPGTGKSSSFSGQ